MFASTFVFNQKIKWGCCIKEKIFALTFVFGQ